MSDDSQAEEPELYTQSEARAEAKRLNENGKAGPGYCYIAQAYPRGAWGGTEKGWVVDLTRLPN